VRRSLGLLTSLEGKKGYPRNRPPRLTVRGLYQKPTVINNVETLSNVAGIIRDGRGGIQARSARPRAPARSSSRSPATSRKPGVYEVEYGYPWAKFLYEDCGGMLGAGDQVRRARRHLHQGAHRAEIETSPRPRIGEPPPARAVGSGGMIVIAEGTCMVRLLQVMLRFYHHESCGQCTPCREGMGWMHRIIDRIVAGGAQPEDIERLYASPSQRRHHHLRHGRRRGLRHAGHPRQVPRRVRVLHRAQALEVRREARRSCQNARMPEIFINGVPVTGRRPDRHAGRARATASSSRTSAGTRAVGAGNCRICVVEVEEGGGELGRHRLQHAGHEGHARADEFRQGAQRRKARCSSSR
jgi:hypothetical protein